MRKVMSGERFGWRTLAIGPAAFAFMAVLLFVGGLIRPSFSIGDCAEPTFCPKLVCPLNENAKMNRSDASDLLLTLSLKTIFAFAKNLTLIIPRLLWPSMSA